MENKPIPVIDLFAGPGGLGEGFSAAGGRKRAGYFQVHLSIEKDSVAYTTLRLRSFFRKFPYGKAPKKYYDLLRGEIESRELFNKYPKEARAAENEVWCAELGGRKTPGSEVDNRIKHAIGNSDKWVLIGGPPCQAYSIIGRSRNRAVKGYRIEADKRHSLYQEYLRIIYRHWPPVFVMENVKGLLSSRANGNGLFSQILSDLKNPAAIYKQSNVYLFSNFCGVLY
ncbi:MAG: DNA cytosine methyltransferase [Nitrospinota bacterium]